MCLLGAPVQFVNAQFTEFSDTYLITLFDICKAEVDAEIGETVATKDLLAIFVAGGHARETAFVDDYDMLFLLNSKDEDIRTYGNKIASRMNSQIIRRAILPHYRFADHFGHYVTLIDELDEYLSSGGEAVVVDKSQVLGSRMIVGSKKFKKTFLKKIIRPHVFDKKTDYIKRMITEIQSRRAESDKLPSDEGNLKEGAGGLRDIEMTLLICKAQYELEQPITVDLINELKEVAPQLKNDLDTLKNGVEFFEKLRGIYRLTVSAEDELRPGYLCRAAEIMGFENDEKIAACDKIMKAYDDVTKETAEVVDRILTDLKERVLEK
jgi:UTP:GlnB (protein PII) uridylyltransferase